MTAERPAPPALAKKLLRLVVRRRDFGHVAGDFEELFQAVLEEKGRLRARLWYWGHALGSIPSLIYNSLLWNMAVFRSYLTVTFRNIRRQKMYSLINISGLAIGLASCLLLLLWVRDELSFDRFHTHADSLYRVVIRSDNTDYLIVPGGLAPALKAEIPEIVNTMRTAPNQQRLLQHGEVRFYEDDVLLADPSLFEMFDFAFLQGDPGAALNAPDKVVLTESLARKLFGGDMPLGKTLIMNAGQECRVSGIIEDIPHNSHFRFSMVRSFEIIPEHLKKWDNSQWNTYVQLRDDAAVEDVNSKITALVRRYRSNSESLFYLQPLKDTRLYSSAFQYDSALRGDIKYVYIFSALALFILLIACINFMNLSTARSGNRAQEVGLRKVVGAGRKDLIRQFFGESLILAFIALVLALGLMVLGLPLFNALSGKHLSLAVAADAHVWLLLAGVALAAGLVSGSYPALLLSAFHPARVLKGWAGTGARGGVFRKALVVLQFTFTVFLIIGTFTIFNQLRFMQQSRLGFEREHILYMQMRGGLNERYEAVKAELLDSSAILDVTTSYVPLTIGSGCYGVWDGKRPEDEVHMYVASVDSNFVDFFGMEMAAGRFFSPEFPSDRTEAFVINEAAARAMKMSDAVGQRFGIAGGQILGRIIGVVEDFHYRPLHEAIEPFVFIWRPEQFWQMAVKVAPGRMPAALGHLESTWEVFAPGFPPNYQFVDATLDNRYQTERRTGALFRYFTALAVLIACLGLFGLASFMAEQRTKEIGVRKVLGASVSGLAALLTREFARWVLLGNLVAWPLAYWAAQSWLQGFAYRTQVKLWLFPAAGALSLAVALLTVGYQAVRAARSHPIDALRYE